MTISQFNHSADPARILVLEDDPSTAELIGMLFEMSGYQTLILAEPGDITQLVNTFLPDLILMDYLLPGTNGGELCHQVKSDPAISHIPVVIYSAFPKTMCIRRCPNYDAFIAKPFDIEQLSETISRLLARSRQFQIK